MLLTIYTLKQHQCPTKIQSLFLRLSTVVLMWLICTCLISKAAKLECSPTISYSKTTVTCIKL
jgi:hypothetical protein